MLFRIEDVSGFEPNLRVNANEYCFDKMEVDVRIAQMIREEVNGSKTRKLLSYSKSLATCLLKYNIYMGGVLHICIDDQGDYISYSSSEGDKDCRYSIEDRIYGEPLFNENGQIRLLSLNIDVSDNVLLDVYLKKYTNVGMYPYASPEKDSEVVVMNPPNDLVIRQYIDEVYILYALQLRYNFLNRVGVKEALVSNLKNMAESDYEDCSQEIELIICLIRYLSHCWEYEYQISQQIYIYSDKEERISPCYDPIAQLYAIKNLDFEEAYNDISSYNYDKISNIFLEYCRRNIVY